jgi:hypothetical protein
MNFPIGIDVFTMLVKTTAVLASFDVRAALDRHDALLCQSSEETS